MNILILLIIYIICNFIGYAILSNFIADKAYYMVIDYLNNKNDIGGNENE